MLRMKSVRGLSDKVAFLTGVPRDADKNVVISLPFLNGAVSYQPVQEIQGMEKRKADCGYVTFSSEVEKIDAILAFNCWKNINASV